MSNLSSNCLFHFTSSADQLIGILTDDFHPQYCLEKTPLNPEYSRGALDCAIAMVCFCDISLGQIKDHVNTYGSYGIGMTKEWGTKHKLNPVIYVNERSTLALALSKMVEQTDNIDEFGQAGLVLFEEFLSISNYLKPYKGEFLRNGALIKNVKFYNEREWRYIAPCSEKDGTNQVLNKNEYANSVTLAQENSKLKKHKLTFEPDDIKYIFVKDASEILAMVRALKAIKGTKYSADTIEILTSRILTTEQIMNDF